MNISKIWSDELRLLGSFTEAWEAHPHPITLTAISTSCHYQDPIGDWLTPMRQLEIDMSVKSSVIGKWLVAEE